MANDTKQHDRVFHVVLIDHGIRDPLRGRKYLSVAELTRLLADAAFELPHGVVMLRIDEVTKNGANDDNDSNNN